MTRHNVPTPVNLRSRLQAVVGCRSDLQMPSGPSGDYVLLEGLVDYWPGDESSGQLVGGINGVELTAVNSPGTAAGVGAGQTARDLDAAFAQYFSSANGEHNMHGQDFEFLCWVYRAGAVTDFVFNRGAETNSPLYGGPALSFTGASGMLCKGCDSNYSNAWNGYAFVPSSGAAPILTWLLVSYRAVGGFATVSIDGVDGTPFAIASGSVGSATNAPFQIGKPRNSSNYLTGRVAGAGLWIGRTLSQAQREWLLNGKVAMRTAAEVAAYAGS